jgi:N-acetylglucosaminyldiphosphoundecaprenol N-acetyl-beta-D-mannosaminyltransferase
MKKYFDIYIEFDKENIIKGINECIKHSQKGYVCVVDGNVLATAHKQKVYKKIINGGLVNSCDGSSIALLAGKIHKCKFETYTGPDIFSKYVKENYKQYFLGNTDDNLLRLKNRFVALGYNADNFKFESLPFRGVNDFDYKTIANEIQVFSPDIIWVSLGAPKQEIFISKLYPYLDKGVLFAIGAAFNLFLGDDKNKRAPKIMRRMHLEWLFRVLQEPNRVGKRAFAYLIVLPKLIFQEIKNKNINIYK